MLTVAYAQRHIEILKDAGRQTVTQTLTWIDTETHTQTHTHPYLLASLEASCDLVDLCICTETQRDTQ